MTSSHTQPATRAAKARRWWIWTAVGTAGLIAGAWWLGVAPGYAVLLGLCLALVSACARAADVPSWVRFPRLPYNRRDGARRDVSTLSWSLYGQGRNLNERALLRLHRAGVAACRHAGVDLDDDEGRARAADLLGTQTADFLLDPAAAAVDARRMSHLLDDFEQLDLRKG
ncbi:MAG TPA: hypothetical protein VK095_02130 [Beutenbergiaceae bacterium]|nr:hypothetical protein [Beutenbergiaceae bacterium]